MKAVNVILKVVAALAAVAGVVYVIVTYGDRIVAWVKKFVNSLPCNRDVYPLSEEEFEAAAPKAEDVPAEEPAAEPEAAPEEPAEPTPVAEDADFEG